MARTFLVAKTRHHHFREEPYNTTTHQPQQSQIQVFMWVKKSVKCNCICLPRLDNKASLTSSEFFIALFPAPPPSFPSSVYFRIPVASFGSKKALRSNSRAFSSENFLGWHTLVATCFVQVWCASRHALPQFQVSSTPWPTDHSKHSALYIQVHVAMYVSYATKKMYIKQHDLSTHTKLGEGDLKRLFCSSSVYTAVWVPQGTISFIYYRANLTSLHNWSVITWERLTRVNKHPGHKCTT